MAPRSAPERLRSAFLFAGLFFALTARETVLAQPKAAKLGKSAPNTGSAGASTGGLGEGSVASVSLTVPSALAAPPNAPPMAPAAATPSEVIAAGQAIAGGAAHAPVQANRTNAASAAAQEKTVGKSVASAAERTDIDFDQAGEIKRRAMLEPDATAKEDGQNRTSRGSSLPLGARTQVETAARAPDSASGKFEDSSVELEIDAYPQIMDLLTVPDDTVAGLLGDIPAPDDFAGIGGGKAPKDVVWHSLPADQKLVLLRHVSRSAEIDFGQSRIVPRISLKMKVDLVFSRETDFLGKMYPPGRHLVNLSGVLQDSVHYLHQGDVKAVTGLELHFRSNQSAGKVSDDARTFLEGLGVPGVHQHIHIVAPLPVAALEREPDVQSAAMGDFVRRVNLLAEMTTIIDEMAAIANIADKDAVYFTHATPEMFYGLTQYFLFVGDQFENRRIGDYYKTGWVGFRGSDKYDKPGLYGLEYRAIGANVNKVKYREILNRVQRSMLRDDYGIPKEKVREWLVRQRRRGAPDSPTAVSWAYYNHDWEVLAALAPSPVKKTLLGKANFFEFNRRLFPDLRRMIERSASSLRRTLLKHRLVKETLPERLARQLPEHAELKMLVHNWIADPLFLDDEDAHARIVTEQVRALKRCSTSA